MTMRKRRKEMTKFYMQTSTNPPLDQGPMLQLIANQLNMPKFDLKIKEKIHKTLQKYCACILKNT